MLDLKFLDVIREAELDQLLPYLERASRILELGGGTGAQAKYLANHGLSLESIDLESSVYAPDRVFPVIDYDGKSIPFADNTFDLVFSSNVLEHIGDLPTMHDELRRVLVDQGVQVHAMPTASWRFWTTVANYVGLCMLLLKECPQLIPRGFGTNALMICRREIFQILGTIRARMLPGRHGEFGTSLTELFTFSRWAWRRHFRAHGYEIEHCTPTGLFYTGHMILGPRLSIQARRRIAPWLGSACLIYVVKDAASRRRPRTVDA